MKRLSVFLTAMFVSGAAMAGVGAQSFESIDGGTLNLADWAGQPVLVVNTASQCGFTGQYDGLQALYDTYRAEGLIVLAVPSDDFSQELDSEEEVKEFCELNFALDVPMTEITNVKGTKAHPFYRAVAQQTGFVPAWNFNKVLIGPSGDVIDTWGAHTRPQSKQIVREIERLLTR